MVESNAAKTQCTRFSNLTLSLQIKGFIPTVKTSVLPMRCLYMWPDRASVSLGNACANKTQTQAACKLFVTRILVNRTVLSEKGKVYYKDMSLKVKYYALLVKKCFLYVECVECSLHFEAMSRCVCVPLINCNVSL